MTAQEYQTKFKVTNFPVSVIALLIQFTLDIIPREARAEGPSVARLINLSGRAGPSGAKPREIYLFLAKRGPKARA